MTRVLFHTGYSVKLHGGRNYSVLSVKDISMRDCKNPVCPRIFSRDIYSGGREKIYCNTQCAGEHRQRRST